VPCIARLAVSKLLRPHEMTLIRGRLPKKAEVEYSLILLVLPQPSPFHLLPPSASLSP